jgi:hypothetical protein
MIHVEGYEDELTLADTPDGSNATLERMQEIAFRAHLAKIDALVNLADTYGVKLSLEPTSTFVTVHNRLGLSTLLDYVSRGHSIAPHFDLMQAPDSAAAVALMNDARAGLASAGLSPPAYASGICQSYDWVSALSTAGFSGAVAMVGYCLKSYSSAAAVPAIPAFYRDVYRSCTAPSDCHMVVPYRLHNQVHPWMAADGSNWLTPATSGIILVPNSGSPDCAAEADAAPAGSSFTTCTLDSDDVRVIQKQILRVYAMRAPGTLTTYALVYSLGTPIEGTGLSALESLFAQIQIWQTAGKVAWKTVPQVLNLQKNL